MAINPIIKIIRAKKLGVLIRDARLKSGKRVDDVAQALGLSTDELTAIEFGEKPPSLPEVEILAYYLEIPLEHFWGSEALKKVDTEKIYDPMEIKQLRQNNIGSLIRKARIESGLTLEDAAQKAGIEPKMIATYEQGEIPVPLPELEILAQILEKPITGFEDQDSPVGKWFSEKNNVHEFLGLTEELQEFVSKPVNRPYLELAVRLSELRVEKLRALAEGLLEITL